MRLNLSEDNLNTNQVKTESNQDNLGLNPMKISRARRDDFVGPNVGRRREDLKPIVAKHF
jgi:hypothetical protein